MMDIDFKVILESIKSWPRGLRIVAAILVLDVFVVLYVVAFFADNVAEQDAQLQTARASVQDLRRKLTVVRADVAALDQLRQSYERFTATTAVSRLDRVALVRNIDGLRVRHRLSGLHFRFSPEAVTALPDSTYQLVEMPVELAGESMLDSDLVAFWQEAIVAVSPEYSLSSLTLERMQQPTPAMLQLIRDGQPQILVSGKVQFRALSLRRPGGPKEGL
jgi:hypothetical protein